MPRIEAFYRALRFKDARNRGGAHQFFPHRTQGHTRLIDAALNTILLRRIIDAIWNPTASLGLKHSTIRYDTRPWTEVSRIPQPSSRDVLPGLNSLTPKNRGPNRLERSSRLTSVFGTGSTRESRLPLHVFQPQSNPKYHCSKCLYGSLALFETPNRALQLVENTLLTSLITQRSLVQIQPPQPIRSSETHHKQLIVAD